MWGVNITRVIQSIPIFCPANHKEYGISASSRLWPANWKLFQNNQPWRTIFIERFCRLFKLFIHFKPEDIDELGKRVNPPITILLTEKDKWLIKSYLRLHRIRQYAINHPEKSTDSIGTHPSRNIQEWIFLSSFQFKNLLLMKNFRVFPLDFSHLFANNTIFNYTFYQHHNLFISNCSQY